VSRSALAVKLLAEVLSRRGRPREGEFASRRAVSLPPMAESEIFLAYPSRPETVRATLATAGERIDQIGGVKARSWEGLQVGGRLVITEVLRAIDRAAASVFEVTELNSNVLFELGYAVGAQKHVFPVLDDAVEDATREYSLTRLLTPIGYTPYHSSEDIFTAFLNERPDLRDETLFDQLVAPTLRPPGSPTLLYVQSLYADDASGALTRAVRSEAQRGIRLTVADPRETSVQPLTWFAQEINDAAAVVIHFESPRKVGSSLHNARCAFLGGFAHGMGKPMLMFASEDYSAPFDYRDLLYPYSNAADLAGRSRCARNASERASFNGSSSAAANPGRSTTSKPSSSSFFLAPCSPPLNSLGLSALPGGFWNASAAPAIAFESAKRPFLRTKYRRARPNPYFSKKLSRPSSSNSSRADSTASRETSSSNGTQYIYCA
jgi:hypothetical protein